MKLVYGGRKKKSKSDTIYLTENDLNIPIGIEGYDKSLTFLNNIENKDFLGLKLPEVFQYSNTSLWWFIYPTIFPSIQRTINFIYAITALIEKLKPSSIQLIGEFDKYNIFKQICQEKNIPLISSNIILKTSKLKIKNKFQRIRYQRIFLQKTKDRLSLFERKNNLIPNVDGKIIFGIPTVYRRKLFDMNLGISKQGEYIQGEMIKLLQSKYDVIGMDIDYTFRGNPHILDQRLNDDIPWFPIESIVKKYSFENHSLKFLKKFDVILESDIFKSLFSFQGINFWEQIKFDFNKLSYDPFIPHYIELIESFMKYFAENKPRAIFLPYETGPYALALIIAATANHIKTIGIQHGLIWKNNSDYSHTKFKTPENLFGMPLPDMTLIFGKFTKEILMESKYPENKFLVFGNPEFFQIDKIIKNFNHDETRLQYNISKNKKILLFTTGKSQSFYKDLGGKLNYDEQVLEKLLDKYNNNDFFHVIVKPHPDENIEVYEKIIKKFNSNNFTIIQDDLFQLILISDVIISIFSTVLMDSISLGKMTIRVKFPENTIPIPYDDYNVLFSSDLPSLSNSIKKILTDETLRKNLDENRILFLKYIYGVPNHNIVEQLDSMFKN
jgi:hypothetical protein